MVKENPIHKGSHFKKIISKGSWYLAASIITKAMAILILPITTRILSEHEIGILDSLETIKIFLPIVISLALDEAYYRFFVGYKKSEKDLKIFVSTYFWIILIWGFFIFTISLLTGKFLLTKLFKIPFYPFIPLTMVGPLLLQLKILGEVYLKQRLKSGIVSIFNVLVYAVFYAVFLFLLIVPKLGAEAKIYAFFISDTLAFLIFTIIILKDNLIGFYFDKKILIEGLKYSVFLIPNNALQWITGLSDRLIIGIFVNFSSTGIYSIGYKLGQTITMFSNAVFGVYKPIMFSMFEENREEAIKKIESFVHAFFFIMFWGAFCLGFFSKEIIYILTGPKFHEAYIIVPIVASAYFFGAIYKVFYNILSYFKKTWVFFVGSLIQALSNIVLNIIFIPAFDRIAAAWSTLLSYIFLFFWLFLWSQKFQKIRIEWKKIILIIITGGLVFALYFGMNKLAGYFFADRLLSFSSYLSMNFKGFATIIESGISCLIKLLFVGIGLLISIKLNLIELGFFKLK